MINLTDDQKAAVTSWVAQGYSLTEIQKRLNSEFQHALTFMDLRMLILDLNLKIKDRASQSLELNLPKQPARATGEALPEDASELPAGAGGVSVTLDQIVKPGAVVSGSVRFSDGVTATWMLDQMGRLALDAGGNRAYRPSPEDVQAFQEELRALLQTRGY